MSQMCVCMCATCDASADEFNYVNQKQFRSQIQLQQPPHPGSD